MTLKERIAGFMQPKYSGNNAFDKWLMQWLGTNAIYPNDSNYVENYATNNILFTCINKIVDPASKLPVFQYDKDGNIKEGKMIQRLNKPNPYQSRNEFLESVFTFFQIYGESFTSYESVTGGLNEGLPARIDNLPPSMITLNLGNFFNPVKGYSFYPFNSGTEINYTKGQVFHWKDFNPDYSVDGGHLRGMSKMRPLFKTIVGSNEAYNSLVKAFQNQGAWGLLTILGEDGKGSTFTKQQATMLKDQFREDAKRGQFTVTGRQSEWVQAGLSVTELKVLESLNSFSGYIYDAYGVPAMLASGSQDRTYENYSVAERALWSNAIKPMVDGFLEGLTNWLAPLYKEEGDVLRADYSGIEALQKNIGEMVSWMVASKSFTKNEIREAAGFDRLTVPGMDDVFDSFGLVPVAQMGLPPIDTEEAMKALNIKDYRNVNRS
jgi:HK97 family phage portal protein